MPQNVPSFHIPTQLLFFFFLDGRTMMEISLWSLSVADAVSFFTHISWDPFIISARASLTSKIQDLCTAN